MAPRMIQSMEILRMAATELEEKIEQELIENPILEQHTVDPDSTPEEKPKKEKEKDVEQKELVIEEGDNANNEDDFERLVNLDQDVPDHFDERPRVSSNRVQESGDRQHDLMANVATRSETLQDYLLSQLGEREVEPDVMKFCEKIISAISAESGGYFKASLTDLLPLDASPEAIELAEIALAHVQDLEPKGVGARDLKECLLLQLTLDIENYHSVHKLIVDHLDDLMHNRLPVIEKATGMSIEEIYAARDELRKLDPRPASEFADNFVAVVKPDLWLEQDDEGKWVVKMDEGPARNLYISRYYRERLKKGKATKAEKEFIKGKISSAQWLIESIEQRRSTLLRVAQAIFDHQSDFIDKGPEFLKALKMDQIAERVGVNLSTVSRAVDDKYIETPRGIVALRAFFIQGTQTDAGEDVTYNKIRIELQKLIDNEDKAKPLSDFEIMNRLKNMSFDIARRTVSKYREKMGIPNTRQRRDYRAAKK
ncbi:RNA polymerase sigma-54 factor [Mariniblastus fucicola]|uniref:RNA polymerase sigma-54 factor n=2 Tax=Mariniblastus fucicola TaxID=980251 RepID=A0A5B9P8M5_9BACT|nr:RNA polymerase sigma-54 factor [Mariniblastus fucicola]